jgi:hypothetical protein
VVDNSKQLVALYSTKLLVNIERIVLRVFKAYKIAKVAIVMRSLGGDF